MEESAVVVARLFTRLIMPIGAIAFIVGVLTIVKGFGGFSGAHNPELAAAGSAPAGPAREGSSLLERVAAGLCGTLAVVLVLLLGVNAAQSGIGASFWPAILLVMFLLLGAPAILGNTRYRMVGEGIATVAIAGMAIVTGFSIGFLFVPIVVLMIWLCILQLRPSKRRA
jgi:hypothetical protein